MMTFPDKLMAVQYYPVIIALIAGLLFQAQPPAPLNAVGSILQQLKDHLSDHRPTFGATADLTVAKHMLRDWVELQLADQGENVDAKEFAGALQAGLRDAGMFCDDCDSVNYLGYVDDIRVNRQANFLVIVTATGISCGYDESAYVYMWNGRQWRRAWDHEQNTYTPAGYLPQQIHDIQISTADAAGNRLLLLLSSQTMCGGAFKNLYARAWRITAVNEFKSVLNWTGFGNDGYPPLTGRAFADDVLFEYTAGGLISGQSHTAVRHFEIREKVATPVDPIAGRPHDFVLEWLAAPWSESGVRSASASLEVLHAQLRREDAAGDEPEPTLHCTGEPDLWQVTTRLYERPKRYYRRAVARTVHIHDDRDQRSSLSRLHEAGRRRRKLSQYPQQCALNLAGAGRKGFEKSVAAPVHNDPAKALLDRPQRAASFCIAFTSGRSG